MADEQILFSGLSSERFFSEIRDIIRAELRTQEAPQKNKKYLNLDEVALLLGASKSKIYRLTSEQTIPFIKVGGKLLFKETDIIFWIDSKSVGKSKVKSPRMPSHNSKAFN